MRTKMVVIPLGIAVIAIAIGALISVASIAIMLRALHVFTEEKVVAEVVMYPIQADERGEYIEIEYTAVLSSDNGVDQYGEEVTYKLYGDTVAIRGPFIKLHDTLLFIDYENVYKLTVIEGEYRRATNAGSGEGTEVTINGGFDDSWWNFNSREASFPFSLVIDRMTISGDEEFGFYGTGRKRYDIVVTHDTITWNLRGTFRN